MISVLHDKEFWKYPSWSKPRAQKQGPSGRKITKPKMWMEELLLESRKSGPRALAFEHTVWLAHQEHESNSQMSSQATVEAEALEEVS